MKGLFVVLLTFIFSHILTHIGWSNKNHIFDLSSFIIFMVIMDYWTTSTWNNCLNLNFLFVNGLTCPSIDCPRVTEHLTPAAFPRRKKSSWCVRRAAPATVSGTSQSLRHPFFVIKSKCKSHHKYEKGFK